MVGYICIELCLCVVLALQWFVLVKFRSKIFAFYFILDEDSEFWAQNYYSRISNYSTLCNPRFNIKGYYLFWFAIVEKNY